MELGAAAGSNLLTSHDCQNTYGQVLHCAKTLIHIHCTHIHIHTHACFISPESHLCSLAELTTLQANTCTSANTHYAQSHQIQSCWQLLIGLIHSSYSDRPNKSEQHLFIHFSLPLAWGLRHSRQSQQGGVRVPFYCGKRPGKAAQHSHCWAADSGTL